MNTAIKFELKPLPFEYDALETFIDKKTVEIHYSKHHKAYFDNFLEAIKGTEIETMEITDIFKNISKYPVAVRNNGGGYYNHTFYWEGLKANGGEFYPTCKLSEAIVAYFWFYRKSSKNNFQKQEKQDLAVVGYGSAWTIKASYLFALHQTKIIH